MTGRRGYNLMCPMARTLDLVGDRWTLLILRDLHAGPAGFNELQHGLGVASNLLSTRLKSMQEDGLVERATDGAYRLTPLGVDTAPILAALAAFGRGLPEPEEPRQHGNLRTAYLPITTIFEQAGERVPMVARIVIDGESFTVELTDDSVDVVYNDPSIPADVVASTTYENFMDLAAGRVTLDEHLARFELDGAGEDAEAFTSMYSRGLAAVAGVPA